MFIKNTVFLFMFVLLHFFTLFTAIFLCVVTSDKYKVLKRWLCEGRQIHGKK